jgi:organic radical activating enzyme
MQEKKIKDNKSVFMTAADEMKDKLGPSLCLAKWQQVSLHLPTGMTNSCYHPPLHKIDAEPLKFHPGKLHNTKHKKLQRKLMKEGIRPEECSTCWSAEDNGQLSDRHYRSSEPWASEHYDKITNEAWDKDVVPSYVEVNFSHACNLACSYCSPQFSSTWGKDVNRWGPYPTSKPHNNPEHLPKPIPVREDNPYVDAFWKWWPELYPKLKHFRMTGGEPLMDKNTHRVFDYILSFPKSDLHVDVTSNFSVEPTLFDPYFDKVKQLCKGERIEHFMQYVSVDTGDPMKAEYIRDGLDYNRLIRYVEKFLGKIPERNSLTFIITLNNLSITSLQLLLQRILTYRKAYNIDYQRVWFDTPVLRSPTWQSIQILPLSYVRQLEDIVEWMKRNQTDEEDNKLIGFKDYEIQRMERNLAWMKEELDDSYIKEQRADFYRFFEEYDLRRNRDFVTVFPEMREWYQECKFHAGK